MSAPSEEYSFNQTLLTLVAHYHLTPFFSISVSVDSKNSSSNIIQVGDPPRNRPARPLCSAPQPGLVTPLSRRCCCFFSSRSTSQGWGCRPGITTSTKPRTRK